MVVHLILSKTLSEKLGNIYGRNAYGKRNLARMNLEAIRPAHPEERTDLEKDLKITPEQAASIARKLTAEYYYRFEVPAEIFDLERMHGPIAKMREAISALAERVCDKYTTLLGPVDCKDNENQMNGIRNSVTDTRYTIWTKLVSAGRTNVGYASYPMFYCKSANKVRQKLKNLPRKKGSQKPMDALVVDLRGNLGGQTDQADQMLGLFLDDASYLLERYPGQSLEYMHEKTIEGKPINRWNDMFILINSQSSSSSNIFAGTMREFGRAVLVGEKSHHKCVQQSYFTVQEEPKIQLKYTNAKIMMRSGFDIHSSGGLEPDYSIDELMQGRLTDNESFNRVMNTFPIFASQRQPVHP